MKIISWVAVCATISFLTMCMGQVQNNLPAQTRSKPATKSVGGGCDGCELMYVGMPAYIPANHTSMGWGQKGVKLLLTGKVLQFDGKTPASDVILYYWHTNHKGLYENSVKNEAKQHGQIRGWVKTDRNGRYSIYTARPMPYPTMEEPAHIHVVVKEPNLNEYYIDDVVFDDDPLVLKAKKRKPFANRGGSGIVRVLLDKSEGKQIAEHNITLGLNIPNYPQTIVEESGLAVGEDSPSFEPLHIWGADKNTKTCPVCKYGRYHGILYFVNKSSDVGSIKKWLAYLEKESQKRAKYLKVYLVYGESNPQILSDIGKDLNLQSVALTCVPSWNDVESDVYLNKINPSVDNTFVIYKNRQIVGKFVNFSPTKENFLQMSELLEHTKGDYFNLPEPSHD